MFINRIFNRVLLILAAGVLAFSCGGNGGGGGDGGGGGGAQRVAITADNAPEVAETAVDAADFVLELADFNEFLLDGFSELPAARGLDRATRKATALRRLGRTTLALVIQDTEECDLGGSIDITADVEPVEMLVEGDMFTAEFNSCVLLLDVDDDVATFDGTIVFEVTSVSGAFPIAPFGLTLAYDFENLRVTDEEGTVTIDGGFDLSLATEDDVVFESMLNIPSVKVSEPGWSGKIADFTAQGTSNENTGAYTFDMEGTVSDSDLGGFVTMQTTTPFTGVEPNDPGSGVLVVTGADNSTLTLVALDSVNVELRVDEDGDGTPEEIIPTTWEELELEF